MMRNKLSFFVILVLTIVLFTSTSCVKDGNTRFETTESYTESTTIT